MSGHPPMRTTGKANRVKQVGMKRNCLFVSYKNDNIIRTSDANFFDMTSHFLFISFSSFLIFKQFSGLLFGRKTKVLQEILKFIP